MRHRCLIERVAAADRRHRQALGEWSALPRRRRWMTRRPERESPGLPSRQELAVARNELFGVVRAAMAAKLERVMPRPRPPSEPARTRPAETMRRQDAPSPPSRAPLRSEDEVERPAEGKRPVRGPTRGHAVQTGAGDVAARAHDAAGPGTGTELLIDTRDDSGGSCPAAARSRSASPARRLRSPPRPRPDLRRLGPVGCTAGRLAGRYHRPIM